MSRCGEQLVRSCFCWCRANQLPASFPYKLLVVWSVSPAIYSDVVSRLVYFGLFFFG